MTDKKTTATTTATADEDAQPLVQIVLQIPDATIHVLPTNNQNTKKLIGSGILKVYSSVPARSSYGPSHATSSSPAPSSPSPSSSSTASSTVSSLSSSPPPLTTFMSLETSDPSKSSKSLITHPLLPRSTAEKLDARTWLFPVPGNGSIELSLSKATLQDIASFENLLADRIVYSNQYDLRNSLALVDDAGRVFGVLDKDTAEIIDEDDAVSLSENQKSPVIIHEADEDEEEEVVARGRGRGEGDSTIAGNRIKRIKLKVTLPSSDDMASWLTTASQYLGEGMIKSATIVAGGLESTNEYLNAKIPESTKPLKISPFIKNRVRNLTKVSRKTFSATGRIKQAVVSKALGMGFKTLKYWTAGSDDPENYSTLQHLAYAILNSAGILIQSYEESINIVAAPAMAVTQDLTGKALGPDAKELVTEALEGFKNFTLVYFDSLGISRRAFLKTGRVAALQTAREIREGKIKLRTPQQKQQQEQEAEDDTKMETDDVEKSEGAISSGIRQAKELIFRYFGHSGNGDPSSSSSDAEDLDSNNKGETTHKHARDPTTSTPSPATAAATSDPSSSPKKKKVD
ncbi:hypothetical protein BGW41_003211 [Actinomortierella wolfii]|nr:hypothetical protein BGW41_003211 [Actinomortierella wolfii]